MLRLLRQTFLSLIAFSFCLLSASGQNMQLASMNQDVEFLKQKVQQLVLRLELAESQNAELQRQLNTQLKQQQEIVKSFNALNASVNTRFEALSVKDAAVKKEIISEVTRQIDALAKQMESGLATLANAIEHQPQVQPQTTIQFSEDYPAEGVAYVVKSGDSLSKIARELNSTVKDIQNANKIVNPSRDLKAGQTIFVPQRK